ncbi:MAG TPA: NAD-dependent deacylase [Casimicrobiaceae bacterium]|nr:NAD-dependent deacylase [Casimicrobiaceae bacterium]
MTASAASFEPALLARLRAARTVAALTGACISAESGIATFRDAQQGLWARFDPRELATPSAFARHPRRVWDWYAWRREQVSAALPNPGHRALAALERRSPGFVLVTQNVDGLHQKGGSRNVAELHGNITRVKCSREGTLVERWEESGPDPPRCARCGAFLRPDVVWFDEMLPEGALAAAEDAVRRCHVLLVIGTSAEVYPAAGLPQAAQASGALVVEINPNATPLSSTADCVLRGPAGIVLPALLSALDSADPG